MKKILSILLAVSMIATAAFAADVSATLAFDGSIYNQTGPELFDLNVTPRSDGGTKFGIDVSSDVAGASFSIKESWAIASRSLWFKPMDGLKVTVGNQSLPVDNILGMLGNGVDGYGIAYDVTDTITAAVNVGGNQSEFKKLNAKVTVGLGGSASAAAIFGMDNEYSLGSGRVPADVISFGVGYFNPVMLDGALTLDLPVKIDIVSNLMGIKGSDMTAITVAPFVSYTITDELSASVLAMLMLIMPKGGDADITVMTIFPLAVTYTLDEDKDVSLGVGFSYASKKFAVGEIEADYNQTVGAAKFSVGICYDVDGKNFSVPVSASISF